MTDGLHLQAGRLRATPKRHRESHEFLDQECRTGSKEIANGPAQTGLFVIKSKVK
jgi:hypothetical protein